MIVQRIVTTWTKRTRGAEGREARARLPTAYPLPDALLVSKAPCLQHFVARGESDGWALEEKHRTREDVSASLGEEHGAVRLSLAAAGEMNIVFVHADECGAPFRRKKQARLLAGSWARVRFNGRFVGYEEAWYEEKVVNIAFGTAATRDLFLATSPSVVLEAMANLL